MRYLLQIGPQHESDIQVRKIFSICMVRYNPLVAFLYGILTGQSSKPQSYFSRFRRNRVEILSPWPIPPPMLPLWLSRPLDSLRIRYPEDRFHHFNVLLTIQYPSGCVGTVDRDLPSSPGTKWKFLPYISCEDCEGKVTFPQRDKFDMEHFEIHLQTPTHRQRVETRKASRINTEHSITSADSELNQVPTLQALSYSDFWGPPDAKFLLPRKDPNSHSLPRSSTSPVPFQLAPDERMEEYPPDRIYPEKMEADLDEVARSSSNSDSEVFDVPEEDDFGDSIYGREHFDRVKNDRKRVAPSSSESANSCGKGRPGKRQRGRRYLEKNNNRLE